ncbi:MAG: TylF/MycF/NovP-related O-methyltransferase [Terriglobia bacterium]
MMFDSPIIRKLFGPIPYFRFGVKHAVKFSSGFTREVTLGRAMDYARASRLEGDYLEFGVWRGRAFAAACYLATRRGLSMNFYAFDSFCGFPNNNEVDAAGHQWFKEGVYNYSELQFIQNVRRTGADMKRVISVPGWFDESLAAGNPRLSNLRKAAVVWVDCDLYSSTCAVLNFITPYLQYGTLMLFDDWFAFRADPNAGQQRAFREWLQRNPQLSAVELMRFGWNGDSFVIHDDAASKLRPAIHEA